MQQLKQTIFPTYLPDTLAAGEIVEKERLALGTAGIGGMWGPVAPEAALNVLLMALSEGITVFDTAPAYGEAEKHLGLALQRWRGELPFISTKVGRLRGKDAADTRYDYSTEGMHQSVLRSRDILGLAQIPLLFLHDPARVPIAERERVWEAMISFRTEGLVKQIGLGGTVDEAWYPFLKSETVDALMEYNNLDAVNLSALHTTVPICRREKISRYQASPLHNGLLGREFESFTQQRPEWMKLSEIEQANRLRTISQKYDIPFDQLALRFVLSVTEVDRVVIGATNLSELSSSLAAWRAGSLPVARFYEICNGLI